jgi:putative transcriptional regulator
MKIRRRLRMAGAQREVSTGAQLRRLLAGQGWPGVVLASVSALFSKEPSQIKLSTLLAWCTALDCTPNDLFEVDTTPIERPATPIRPVVDEPKAAGARGRSMAAKRVLAGAERKTGIALARVASVKGVGLGGPCVVIGGPAIRRETSVL